VGIELLTQDGHRTVRQRLSSRRATRGKISTPFRSTWNSSSPRKEARRVPTELPLSAPEEVPMSAYLPGFARAGSTGKSWCRARTPGTTFSFLCVQPRRPGWV
jgi:hypothetical protein